MNTDAMVRGGAARSSVEALVMSVERRGSVIQLNLVFNHSLKRSCVKRIWSCQLLRHWEEILKTAKPINIPKAVVWAALGLGRINGTYY